MKITRLRIVVLFLFLSTALAFAQTPTPTPGPPAAFNPFLPSKKQIDKSKIPANTTNRRNSSVPQLNPGSGETYQNPPPPQKLNTVPSNNGDRRRSSVPADRRYSPPHTLPSAGISFRSGVRLEKAGNDLIIFDSGTRYVIRRAEFGGKPPPIGLPRNCGRLKHWLDTHKPGSYKWNYGSLLWADHCL